MSTSNNLEAELTCPRCGAMTAMQLECFFGYGNSIDYLLDSIVQWVPRKAVHRGGRPPDGNLDGEGYAVCERCGLDSFWRVIVRDDRITGAEPDETRQPYLDSPASH